MRIVTLTDQQFYPGVVVLLASLHLHGKISGGPVTILLHEELTNQQYEEIHNLFSPYYSEIEFMLIRTLGDFKGVPKEKFVFAQFAKNPLKILIYNWKYKEKILFLDADTMAIRNLRHLLRMPNFTACPSGAFVDRQHYWFERQYTHFNTGMMIFKPDPDIYNGIKALIEAQKGKIMLGDQLFTNEYIWKNKPQIMNIISEDDNCTLVSCRARESLKNVNLIHFTGPAKAWMVKGIAPKREVPHTAYMFSYHWQLYNYVKKYGVEWCVNNLPIWG